MDKDSKRNRSPKRAARKERLQNFLAQEDAIDILVDYIAHGTFITSEGEEIIVPEFQRHLYGFAMMMDIRGNSLAEWVNEDDERKELVDMARRRTGDAMAQGVIDSITNCKAESQVAATLAKAESDARKWAAGIICKDVYGAKAEVTHKGDKDNPIRTVNISSDATPEQAADIYKSILG